MKVNIHEILTRTSLPGGYYTVSDDSLEDIYCMNCQEQYIEDITKPAVPASRKKKQYKDLDFCSIECYREYEERDRRHEFDH